MQPLAAVGSRNDALCAENRAEGRVAQCGEGVLKLSLGVLARGFLAPGGEYLVGVMVVVVTAAAVTVVVVMMVMLMLVLMLVVVAAAGAVRTVVMMVLVLLVLMVMMVLVLFMLMVVMVMMMVMMLVMRLVGDFVQHLGNQIAAALHGFEQLLAGQILPRGGDDAGVLVQAAQHGNGFVQTLLRALCGAGQQDSAGVSDLIFEELAEVLEVHLCLERVNNGDEAVELNVQMGVLNRRDNVGQLADAGRLDEDAVGVVLVYNVMQRLAEVADERAADAARVHFVDNDACILEKAAVDADFTEFVLDEDDLLALERVREQTLDKRGLACAEKTGDNINLCHDLSLHS